MEPALEKTLLTIAKFFDGIKIGYVGNSGYRKTTDLFVLFEALKHLIYENYISPQKTIFMDLGSGDGRVNFFMSYLTRLSIGIEIEDFIYDEITRRRKELQDFLKANKCKELPPNIHIVCGDSLNPETHEKIKTLTGITLEDVDIFYTYLTLHDTFAELINQKAKKGALYMVYGLSEILPRYEGMKLLIPDLGGRKLIALYEKI